MTAFRQGLNIRSGSGQRVASRPCTITARNQPHSFFDFPCLFGLPLPALYSAYFLFPYPLPVISPSPSPLPLPRFLSFRFPSFYPHFHLHLFSPSLSISLPPPALTIPIHRHDTMEPAKTVEPLEAATEALESVSVDANDGVKVSKRQAKKDAKKAQKEQMHKAPKPAKASKPAKDAQKPAATDIYSVGFLANLHKPGENTQKNPERMQEHLAATRGRVFTRFPPEVGHRLSLLEQD